MKEAMSDLDAYLDRVKKDQEFAAAVKDLNDYFKELNVEIKDTVAKNSRGERC